MYNMKGLYIILMVIIASHILCARITCSTSTFNVLTYGAKGDGQTVDTDAFSKAWKDACGTVGGTPTLIIPEGKTFLLQPLIFQGPCKSTTITIELKGTIVAPRVIDDWKFVGDDTKNSSWIRFRNIRGLVVNGGGKIDGQGLLWWKRHPGKSDENSKPTAIRFLQCHDLTLNNLTHIDSPRNHLSIDDCHHISISNLHIMAPEDSPNTDGIDIASSNNVLIHNSIIETGDDCIAINSGSSLINITGIFCGPGHGISVGSLGKNKTYAAVEDIHVKNCTFTRTTNGARIKTFEGGYGYARKITYEDIIFIGVNHPVIIDQYYDPSKADAIGQAVKVTNVTYINLRGTLNNKNKNAIELNCDTTIGCSNIVMENVNITRVDGREAQTTCTKAQGSCTSCYPDVPCLHHHI